MSGMLVWAVILFLSGLALLVLEAFLPSGGFLGVTSIACLLTAIVLGYVGSWVEGTIILVAAVVGVPGAVVVLLKYWPDTPIGRRVLLNVPSSEEVLPDIGQRKSLLGKRGRAQSVMLPSGPVEIDGELIDAVSEGMTIEAGQLVEVVEAGAIRVVVRAVEEEVPVSSPISPEHDPLAEPVDALELDQLKTEPREPLPSEDIPSPSGESLIDDVFSQEVVLDDDDEDSEQGIA